MTVYPNAKLNIGLNITNKRADGFHDLETIFVPVPLRDALEINPSSDGADHFQTLGIEIDCNGKKNLVEKALDLLREKFQIPALDIRLTKNIPTGAGLGGGSADAAFFITAVNDMFSLGMSVPEMEQMAARLGSDCAFFIENTPKYATGRGEVMTDAPAMPDGCQIVIVKPTFSISTAQAYSKVRPQRPISSLLSDYSQPLEDWKTCIKNDFEQFLFPDFPDLQRYKDALYASGAVYAAMTGSGSALFGIFRGTAPRLSDELEAIRVL